MKGIVRDGVIVPVGPLPASWKDGSVVALEAVETPAPTPEEVDAWLERMNELCADGTPDDEAKMQAAIDDHRREAKEWARRRAGLAP